MGYLISSIRVFNFLFPIIIASFSIPAAFSVEDFDLSHNCYNNYTKSGTDTYRSNLDNLLQELNEKAPLRHGFTTASSDRAYGLALCRGDVPEKDCQACLDSASGNITNYCPNSRGAIIWHDFCLLKYSNSSFFGEIDTVNRLALVNVNKATNPKFNGTTVDLLRNLSSRAIGNKMMYAKDTVGCAEGNKTLHGMVQCSRDLTKADCTSCLNTAISDLSRCCVENIGGRVLYGSCQVRYEIYKFLK